MISKPHIGQGVGTKFLQESVLRQEEDAIESASTNIYGRRIRDCHAEVIARRAFRRKITLEMQKHLKSSSSTKLQSSSSEAFDILTMIKNQDDGKILFRLKDSITLHFYASSAPCGNATVRKPLWSIGYFDCVCLYVCIYQVSLYFSFAFSDLILNVALLDVAQKVC